MGDKTQKQPRNHTGFEHACAVSLLVLAVSCCVSGGERANIDEIVARHLDSIGSPEARSAAKSRVGQGSVAFNERISGAVHLDGSAVVASSGPKFKCSLTFNNPQYPGEQFVFTGEAVHVTLIDQQNRSALGNFLNNEPETIREGLLGGVLTTNWPLLDLKASGAKLKFDGTKKIDGRELYAVSYTPKKRDGAGDLGIRLYFEPSTFHHVLTVYQLSSTASLDGEAQASDSGNRTTTVEERFEDFQWVDGLTLPLSWDIRYRVEPSSKAQEFQWKILLSSIVHNKL